MIVGPFHKNVSRLARPIRIRNHIGTGMIPGRCCRPAAAAATGALPMLSQPSCLLVLFLPDCCCCCHIVVAVVKFLSLLPLRLCPVRPVASDPAALPRMLPPLPYCNLETLQRTARGHFGGPSQSAAAAPTPLWPEGCCAGPVLASRGRDVP